MRLIPRLLVTVALAGLVAGRPASVDVLAQADGRSGQATVSGRVLNEGSDEPIADARVALSIRGQQGQTTSTDSDGSFTFTLTLTGPGAMTCTLYAQKAGFVRTQSSATPATTVAVAAGRSAGGVTLRLLRGAAIAGFVVDPAGHPLAGARVEVVHRVNGRWSIAGDVTTTNDLGEFRVFGIPSGAYNLIASPPDSGATGPASHATTLAPTFYPYTIDPSAAGVVTVQAGGDLRGLTIGMVSVEAHTISGVFVDSRGAPVTKAIVSLVSAPGSPAFGFVGHAPTKADGSFAITNIPAGSYVLHAGVPPPSGGGSAIEMASLDVTIDRENVTGLQLVAKPRLAASQRGPR